MNEQEYKERLQAFKSSCRVYKQEKAFLEDAAMKNSKADKKLISFFREDVESVDRTFALIKELCGTSAALMVWLLYIEEKTQAAAAYQLNITRRQLQYSFSQYMHKVFEEERARGTR